jgi:hypothetical protein
MSRYQACLNVQVQMIVPGPSVDDAGDSVRDLFASRHEIRSADITGVTITSMTADAVLRHDNLVLWQELEALRLGTADQRERHIAGRLPDDELLAIARPVLFGAFDGFDVRKKMTASAIPHPHSPGSDAWECVVDAAVNRPYTPLPISWSVLPTPVLSVTEWATLTWVNRAVNDTNRHPWLVDAALGATVATRIHKGVCQRCKREAAQVTALVTVAWAGRMLSREYVL